MNNLSRNDNSSAKSLNQRDIQIYKTISVESTINHTRTSDILLNGRVHLIATKNVLKLLFSNEQIYVIYICKIHLYIYIYTENRAIHMISLCLFFLNHQCRQRSRYKKLNFVFPLSSGYVCFMVIDIKSKGKIYVYINALCVHNSLNYHNSNAQYNTYCFKAHFLKFCADSA